MARKLQQADLPAVQTTQTIYPWKDWLDGGVWELIPGEDFTVRVTSFISAAHGAASRRGTKLHIRNQDGKLLLQAVRK